VKSVQYVSPDDFNRCKSVHLNVALGVQKDEIGILGKIATSVTKTEKVATSMTFRSASVCRPTDSGAWTLKNGRVNQVHMVHISA
jgi:hypothetical protein